MKWIPVIISLSLLLPSLLFLILNTLQYFKDIDSKQKRVFAAVSGVSVAIFLFYSLFQIIAYFFGG